MGRAMPGRAIWTARIAGGALACVAAACVAFYGALLASRPMLDGRVAAPGLAHATVVERDSDGMATLSGRTRVDVAYALGFVHAQERFFQMDLARRTAAGERAELLGDEALKSDLAQRRHRFRRRVEAALPDVDATVREILTAYAAGVNAGLAALSAPPPEYLLLRRRPEPWREEDCLLVGRALAGSLQDPTGRNGTRRAAAAAALGEPLARFLYPVTADDDGALDGSIEPPSPMPEGPAAALERARAEAVPDGTEAAARPGGSNAWAVSGAHTQDARPVLANDMHLRLTIPNTWFWARMVVTGAQTADMTGVTLPGTPNLVAGSNGKVAWGFTNAFVVTQALVRLKEEDGRYLTPQGTRDFERTEERVCSSSGRCETLSVLDTVWGPVLDPAASPRYAQRWIQHDLSPGDEAGVFALERADSLSEAFGAAHASTLPQVNIVAADAAGRIGWTVAGRLPRRRGPDPFLPQDWSDGASGWDGGLRPDEIPSLTDPPDGLLWSANNRMVGGEAFSLIGGDDLADGRRAVQIRDALRGRHSMTEADMIAEQLDDRALYLARWRDWAAGLLAARAADPAVAALIPPIRDWNGTASAESVGYRVVRTLRRSVVERIYAGYATLAPAAARPAMSRPPALSDDVAWKLVTRRPPALTPPGYASWESMFDRSMADLTAEVAAAGGDPSRFTWGARNRAAIRHPLSERFALAAWLYDPSDQGQPGDDEMPRTELPGYGASERFAVSPGAEDRGLLQMPGGQSGHPLAPYFLKGHAAWLEGRSRPFLPGPARWRLTLEPAPSGPPPKAPS